MTEKKIVSYLSNILLDDDVPLERLTHETYAYTYKYTSIARRDATGGYKGHCECYFTCLNNGYRFIQKDNGTPIMWTNTKNLTLVRNAWKVCLKLANLITQKQLENDSFIPEIGDYDINYELKDDEEGLVYDGSYFWSKASNLPIIHTKNYIRKQSDSRKIQKKVLPMINNKTLSCKIGDQKLFTLPFFNCNQYDVFKDCNIVLGSFKLTELMNKRILYKIFNDKYGMLDFELEEEIDYDIIKDFITKRYDKEKNSLIKLSFLESDEEFDFDVDDYKQCSDFHGIELNFEDDQEILEEEYIEEEPMSDDNFGKMILGQNVDYSKIKLQMNKPKIITSGNYLLKKLESMPPIELIYCANLIRKDQIKHHLLEEDYLLNTLLYNYLDSTTLNDYELQI
jgi:hypothetical protein